MYAKTIETVLHQQEVDQTQGLSQQEALKRLNQFGPNKLKDKKKKHIVIRFLEQFKDVMIIILLVAAGISFAVALAEHEGLFEPLLIVAIVVLNALIGVVQEGKAERALEALQVLSSPKARVIRDGKEHHVAASELVPGDIIRIEAGDFVPADSRLIEAAALKVEESALTGESLAAEKDAAAVLAEKTPIGDRINMIYTGCSVVYGRGLAVVVDTGMKTEMGKIASLLESGSDGQTPLQQRLAQLGKYLGILAIAACGLVFLIGLLNNIPLLEIFMIAISLAVSAIPEGLPAIVTVVLAIGVQRMVTKNAIIRKLPAVETLGSASVICSDKTGTLTQNRMTLMQLFLGDSNQVVDFTAEQKSPEIEKLLTYGTLCADGAVDVDENDNVKHIGDPTETAIVYAAHLQGISKKTIEQQSPRVAELPFDSDRKLMTTVHEMGGKYVAITKGAFDALKPRCTMGELDNATQALEDMSGNALRVLGIAYREFDNKPEDITSEALEANLTFLGLVGMIDPPREEVKAAVAMSRQAGMRSVMITGDHVVTAAAIAKQLGIMQDGDEAITGAELDEMSDKELAERVSRIVVYARVSPENKIRIVQAWQAQGHVVAMTGDGVNDAPALRAADIGCAMGITGTDVSKGAADMILTDDNFATIVVAVREGRGIYDNIKKVVGYLLGTNIGEVFSVLGAMLLWHQSPFLAVHLLWINLVTDSLPAIALGMEPVEDDVMKRKPKDKNESIFANGYGVRILLMGVLFGLLTLVGFYLGWRVVAGHSLETGRTMAFAVLALSQTVHAFNMRSSRSIFAIGLFSNLYLLGAFLFSLLAVCFVLFVPAVRDVFSLTALSAGGYIMVAALALVPLVVIEAEKLIRRIRS